VLAGATQIAVHRSVHQRAAGTPAAAVTRRSHTAGLLLMPDEHEYLPEAVQFVPERAHATDVLATMVRVMPTLHETRP